MALSLAARNSRGQCTGFVVMVASLITPIPRSSTTQRPAPVEQKNHSQTEVTDGIASFSLYEGPASQDQAQEADGHQNSWERDELKCHTSTSALADTELVSEGKPSCTYPRIGAEMQEPTADHRRQRSAFTQ